MHLERHLRAGAERQTASVAVDVERSLATVVGAARRRRRLRRAWIGAVSITFMAIGGMIGTQLLSPVREVRSDVPAGLPSPAPAPGQTAAATASPHVIAFGRVADPGLAVVRANGLEGRWTIEVDERGAMSLRAPEAFAGRRDSPLDVVGADHDDHDRVRSWSLPG